MSNLIGQAHKLGKQNRNRLCIKNDPSSVPSTPLNSYKTFNENNDMTGKIALNEKTNYITTSYLEDKLADIIQTEPVSSSYTKHMLI